MIKRSSLDKLSLLELLQLVRRIDAKLAALRRTADPRRRPKSPATKARHPSRDSRPN